MAKKPAASKPGSGNTSLFQLYQGISVAILLGSYLDAILYYNYFKLYHKSPVKVVTKVKERVDEQGSPYDYYRYEVPLLTLTKPTSTERDELVNFIQNPSAGFQSPAKKTADSKKK